MALAVAFTAVDAELKMSAVVRRAGRTKFGVWVVKHVIAPLDSWSIRRTGDASSRDRLGPILLLTTTGRKTGQPRTTPLFYMRTQNDGLVICNVRPPSERSNPWVLNVQANPVVGVQIGLQSNRYLARSATPAELEEYWPRLVTIWPAYNNFLEEGGERTLFVLEPEGRAVNRKTFAKPAWQAQSN